MKSLRFSFQLRGYSSLVHSNDSLLSLLIASLIASVIDSSGDFVLLFCCCLVRTSSLLDLSSSTLSHLSILILSSCSFLSIVFDDSFKVFPLA